MAEPRIHLDLPLSSGQTLTLPETAARHLVQVLRMQPGESFIAFNGQGGEFSASIASVSKRESTAEIGSFHDISRESTLPVTLAQCVSKGERMEYTLQKAVELGVTEIVPLLSTRSVVRMDRERWEKKLEHWRGIIISACEQSGRTRIPQLHPVQELANWLPLAVHAALRLTLAPDAADSLRDVKRSNQPVILLVGPEGGLSADEIATAQRRGFQTIKMGPRILRTETAGVVCLANIQSLWGDLC